MGSVRLRRNDQVYVITGKDRGKSGKVLRLFSGRGKVLVEGINVYKKAVRPNPSKNVKGGLIEREAPVHASNLAVVCPECNSPTRIGFKTLEDGSKVRVCRKCGGVIDKA